MTHIFIINPYSGQSSLADDLRERLSRIEGLNYYVFNTRCAGYEKDLVGKILHFFRGEKLRFYCCGGSGTMRNMLCGFDDLSDAEVAFFPCGLTNDFLKVFGAEAERFKNIEELINGDVIKIDYIKTNCGCALNTISLGLDSEMLQLTDNYRALQIFNDSLPYTVSLIHSIFLSKQHSYEFEIDDKRYSDFTAETIFGNGIFLGGNLYFSNSDNIFDGKGGFIRAGKLSAVKEIKIVASLIKRDLDYCSKECSCGEFHKFRLRRTGGKSFSVNFDGEIQKVDKQLEAKIVRQGLNFVVPKGIKAPSGKEESCNE
ncbi:MAG: diacylglycerol/lipid kinase family protein [Huintestinicola sp.]